MTKERYTGFNGWSNWANTTNSIPAPNRNTGGGGNIRQTLMVDCMGCRNGNPVGITQAPAGQCPPGSTENKNPCTLIQCYTCLNNRAIEVGKAYPETGCNPTGTGPSTSNPDGGCTGSSPTITCYSCVNGSPQGRSYINRLTCPAGETTNQNPCNTPTPGPVLQDDCYMCDTQKVNRVERGTCQKGIIDKGWAAPVNSNGVSNNPCPVNYSGCTNPQAENYDASATIENGSCVLPLYGCSDPDAENYDIFVNNDDGTCEYDDDVEDTSSSSSSKQAGFLQDVPKLVWVALALGVVYYIGKQQK